MSESKCISYKISQGCALSEYLDLPLRARTDQILRCPPEDVLATWLPQGLPTDGSAKKDQTERMRRFI